jgi:hypothetical protein
MGRQNDVGLKGIFQIETEIGSVCVGFFASRLAPFAGAGKNIEGGKSSAASNLHRSGAI